MDYRQERKFDCQIQIGGETTQGIESADLSSFPTYMRRISLWIYLRGGDPKMHSISKEL